MDVVNPVLRFMAARQKGPSACAKRAPETLDASLCRVGTARYRAIPPKNRACEFPRTRLKPLQSPLLQGPALQRQTSGMKLTVAIRVQQDQISESICAAFTLGDAMVDIPPRLLGDQLIA